MVCHDWWALQFEARRMLFAYQGQTLKTADREMCFSLPVMSTYCLIKCMMPLMKGILYLSIMKMVCVCKVGSVGSLKHHRWGALPDLWKTVHINRLAHTNSVNRACIMNNSYLRWLWCAPPLLAPHTLFAIDCFPLTSRQKGFLGCSQLFMRGDLSLCSIFVYAFITDVVK